jgi:GT2 family glycosyltransferase
MPEGELLGIHTQIFEMAMIYIILNWNKCELTLQCISQLSGQEPSAAILVVDNGSSAAEREQLTKGLTENGFTAIEEGAPYPDKCDLPERILLLLRLKRNCGYATGNNYALKLCKELGFDYAIILNNDVVVESANSEAIGRLLSSDERIALIGVDVIQHGRHINPLTSSDSALFLCLSKVLYPLFYPLIQFLYASNRRRIRKISVQGVYRLGRNEFISGCFFACNIRALSEVGNFDSRTFLYSEEIILKTRLEAKGYICVYMSTISVQHRHEETTKLLHWREKDKHLSESQAYYLKEYRGFGPVRLLAVHVGDSTWRYLWRPVTIALSKLLL